MSRFIDGSPERAKYRKFKIRTVDGVNDFAMIYEIVKRRYKKITKLTMPDLVLIDGGKGQRDIAEKALQDLNLDIPCISIAKKNEEVFTFRNSIIIPTSNPGLQILQYARDEAHRFALNYNKLLRKKIFN